jgi:putative DNA primase/helicase
MDFLTCCKLHGILIDSLPRMGVWKRYPTEDHPQKRNGAVKFMGDHGFIQNHATETEVSLWKSDSPQDFDRSKLMRDVQAAEQRTLMRQREAAGKAAWILNQCQFGKHDYLKSKGFPEEEANVWAYEGNKIMVIPMRMNGSLLGCQLIDEHGVKKFLSGQKTAGAEFVFDNKGVHILCEGYATALSVRMALKSLKKRYTIHVCFSAGNMVKVAAALDDGFVIADNDESGTGERVAKQIGWSYWISDKVGEDANDAHQRLGLFKFSQSLTRSIRV